MAVTSPRILLVAESPMGVSFLVTRLKKLAREIHFAGSCKEASAFIANHQFDLVLSEFRLWDGSSYSLAATLIGSRSTLVYSYPLETGCCWLPAVKQGQWYWALTR